MSTDDTDVTAALKNSLDGVTMQTPIDQIITTGRARRRRRRVAGVTTSVVTITGIALGVPALSHPSTAPPGQSTDGVHIRTVAFTLDSQADGTLRVTWDKKKYSTDHAGLESALRGAGFPVLIKEGVFCRGPHDDRHLSPSGIGDGVKRVMYGERQSDGRAPLIFDPRAMPAGQQLFIGYLSPAQLAAVNGSPGSIERLVPKTGPLKCDTQPPLPHVKHNAPGEKRAPVKKPG